MTFPRTHSSACELLNVLRSVLADRSGWMVGWLDSGQLQCKEPARLAFREHTSEPACYGLTTEPGKTLPRPCCVTSAMACASATQHHSRTGLGKDEHHTEYSASPTFLSFVSLATALKRQQQGLLKEDEQEHSMPVRHRTERILQL